MLALMNSHKIKCLIRLRIPNIRGSIQDLVTQIRFVGSERAGVCRWGFTDVGFVAEEWAASRTAVPLGPQQKREHLHAFHKQQVLLSRSLTHTSAGPDVTTLVCHLAILAGPCLWLTSLMHPGWRLTSGEGAAHRCQPPPPIAASHPTASRMRNGVAGVRVVCWILLAPMTGH